MFVKTTTSPQSKFFSKIHTALFISLCVTAMLFLSGCFKKSSTTTVTEPCTACTIDSSGVTSGPAEGATTTGYNAADLVESATFANTVTINFGSSVTVGSALPAGVTITQSNGAVTIRSSVAGVEYQLTGATTNGSVTLYSNYAFKLTLNGINIANAGGPAINIQSTQKAFVVLADNSINSLSDGTGYAASLKGTLYSTGQIILSGNGTLSVTANNNHGIVSDDYIRVRTGNYYITNATGDAIHTTNAFIADGGYFTLTSKSNGINCDAGNVIINNGTFVLNAAVNAITASNTGTNTSVTPDVTINGGNFTIITTTGGGIQSKGTLTISNATISANTVTNGLYAATAVYVNNSNIYCYSTTSNAMESGGTFTITSGKVIAVAKSTKGGFYCGARTFKITGGIVIGTGGATSAPSSTLSTIHAVILGGGAAIQIVHIESAAGTEALTFLAPQAYTTLLFASAKLKASTTYNVYFAGTAGGLSFNGLYYQGGYYKSNTKSSAFTTNSLVTIAGGTVSSN